jgi:hypothetical protein
MVTDLATRYGEVGPGSAVGEMPRVVNGQVRVAADGQKKVPVPWLLLPGFCGSGTSLGSGLAHAERLSFGNHYDRVVQ